MNLKSSPKPSFNPPLRIFSPSSESSQASPYFHRPKLQRFVSHDRVAKHLIKKRFSMSSHA
ncbi:hypothetical protein [Pelagicoccus sp. SDUM812003]|uniref:hypothetical protein n=1 Tax=Pelagicoccus sp. SDUM812003 TaxID=3041267 RepID=UPI00280CF506|nr:hypothetical protein [Pelagicoccus sp. SDUM812003]MDQ8203378.1 hypothetical protein [Pelagicoccus sp. SDUM812003]